LSTSTVVDKWEKENTSQNDLLISKKIQIYPTDKQKSILNEWIFTSNYVYNKAVEYTKNGHPYNFQKLRDILVTYETKKNNSEYIKHEETLKQLRLMKKNFEKNQIMNYFNDYSFIYDVEEAINTEKICFNKKIKNISSLKNENIKEWELKTPKDIRAGAVADLCNAYKVTYDKFKNGKIRYFNFDFRRKNNKKQSIVISPQISKIKNNSFHVYTSILKDDGIFRIKQKLPTNFNIENDIRLIKEDNKYFLQIPVKIEIKNKNKKQYNYCGIDPGIRTFMTTIGSNGIQEIEFRRELLKKLEKKIKKIKNDRKPIHNRRKALRKRERKMDNRINEIHWKTIQHLVSENDVLFYGDIKSHNIVKNSKNKTLNQDFNNIKFHQFKMRLQYKSYVNGKLMIPVNEAYTTKCCSSCGKINFPKESKIYICNYCNLKTGRDYNGAKNILIKGLM
jgi:putative transposase